MGIKKVALVLIFCAVAIVLIWQNTGQLRAPEPPEIINPDNSTIDEYARQGYVVRFVDLEKNPLAVTWTGDRELALQNEREIRALMGDEDKVLFVSFVTSENTGLTRMYSIAQRRPDGIDIWEMAYPVKERYGPSKLFFYVKEKSPQKIIYEKNIVAAQRFIWMASAMACLCILVNAWSISRLLKERSKRKAGSV